MADKKYYVYSARTTEKGLALLNKTKDNLKMGWDKFINDAVCEKYGLDPAVINMPPSEFLLKREETRQAKADKKAADVKAKKDAEKKSKGGKKSTNKNAPSKTTPDAGTTEPPPSAH